MSLLKMRRQSDLCRIILALSVMGLLIGLPKMAVCGEVCATTFSEIEKSDSNLLKDMARKIRGKNLTNRSNTTHLQISSDDLIYFRSFSTSAPDGGELERLEGPATVCDSSNSVKIQSSVMPVASMFMVADGDCIRPQAAFLANPRTTFCPGVMPVQVLTAIEKLTSVVDNRGAASTNDPYRVVR